MPWTFFTKRGAKVVETDPDLLRPVGSVLMYGGTSAPAGWLICDGTTISTGGATAALAAGIGTAYNTGGEPGGTVRLPNMTGKFALGVGASHARGSFTTATSHTHTNAAHSHTGGPGHTHTQPAHTHQIANHGHKINDHPHSNNTLSHDPCSGRERSEGPGGNTAAVENHSHATGFSGTTGDVPWNQLELRAGTTVLSPNVATYVDEFGAATTAANTQASKSATITFPSASTDLPPYRTVLFIIKT